MQNETKIYIQIQSIIILIITLSVLLLGNYTLFSKLSLGIIFLFAIVNICIDRKYTKYLIKEHLEKTKFRYFYTNLELNGELYVTSILNIGTPLFYFGTYVWIMIFNLSFESKFIDKILLNEKLYTFFYYGLFILFINILKYLYYINLKKLFEKKIKYITEMSDEEYYNLSQNRDIKSQKLKKYIKKLRDPKYRIKFVFIFLLIFILQFLIIFKITSCFQITAEQRGRIVTFCMVILLSIELISFNAYIRRKNLE